MKRIATLVPAIAVLWIIAPSLDAVQGTRITTGTLTFEGGVGDIDMGGQSGFSIESRVDRAGGVFEPTEQCTGGDCPPGTVVNLFATWSGGDLSGTATLRGQTFVLGSEGEGGASGLLDFEGTVTLPEMTTDGMVTLTAPVSVSGQLVPVDTGILEPLFGTAIASVTFRKSVDFDAWEFQRATYTITRRSASPTR